MFIREWFYGKPVKEWRITIEPPVKEHIVIIRDGQPVKEHVIDIPNEEEKPAQPSVFSARPTNCT